MFLFENKKYLDLESTLSAMVFIEVNNMKKILTIYYSWSNGNTERIAKMLQEAVGGDIARIDTAIPYEGSYDDVVNQGQEEDLRWVDHCRGIVI